MARRGVAQAVSEILDEMGFLRLALKNDLINYSALARFILPSLEQRLGGRKASMDAVIMAVRRHAKTAGEDDLRSDLLQLLGSARIVLRTGMSVLHLRRSSELYAKLVEFEKTHVNWHAGDKIYVNQRSEELMVIANRKLLPLLHAVIDRDDVLMEYPGVALITIENEEEANKIAGVLAFIANQLEAVNVNMYAVFNSVTKMSFVVSEADAARAYERLNKTFERCRQLSEQGK